MRKSSEPGWPGLMVLASIGIVVALALLVVTLQ
jgi:hypothetical protein